VSTQRALAVRFVLATSTTLGIAAGMIVMSPGNALALGTIQNQALTAADIVHAGTSAAPAASYQIDTTNAFSVGDKIYLKIEGVADPTTTNAGVGFTTTPSVVAIGPSTGAFDGGGVGNVADRVPTFTTALASSAGAATVLGIANELVITFTNSSAGTATDHVAFTVSGIALNVGSATPVGNLNLHAYTGDGTGSLATAVKIATVSTQAVNRLSGADRFATAVAVSTAEFPTAGTAGAVVLARADAYPDALVGTALAAAKGAPLLFTNGNALPAATQAELQRVLPPGGTVFLLGGTSAIPASVASAVTSLGYVVTRYFGADRYGTALAVAAALGNPTTVLLATGIDFPDALAAGPAAARVHGAVLLTDGTFLPPAVATYLTAHPGKVYAIGGPAVVAYPTAQAVVGTDRYATAALVATTFFTGPAAVGIASGVTFADALAGGPLVGRLGGPLLLTDPSVLSPSTSSYLTANQATLASTSLFGGTGAISAVVQTEVGTALGQ
jgi:putative cell wall-binding protein